MSLMEILLALSGVLGAATILVFGSRPSREYRQVAKERDQKFKDLHAPLIAIKRMPDGQFVEREVDPQSLEGYEMRINRLKEISELSERARALIGLP